MKKFLFLFVGIIASAQSKIIVTQNDAKTPIANAAVYCDKTLLGNTDQTGSLTFTTTCNSVTIKAANFESETVTVSKRMEVSLLGDDKTRRIDKAILSSKSDPKAMAILAKLNHKFDQNSPRNQESYTFTGYSKFSIDFDEDSIRKYQNYVGHRRDSLKRLGNNPDLNKVEKKDSLDGERFKKMLSSSKLFLWERALQYKYKKGKGEYIDILDNRISGLKKPVYEALALRSNINQIPNEVKIENWTLYRYFLTDSIQLDGRDTYVIRFRQVGTSGFNRRLYTGYIYVDKENYALAKLVDVGKNKGEFEHVSVWKPFNNSWFLEKESMKFKIGNSIFKDEKEEEVRKKKFGRYAFMSSTYKNFQVPSNDLKPKDFHGYTYQVKSLDGSQLFRYRADSLTQRDKNTYAKIDSLSEAKRLEGKIKFAANIVRGRIRWGNIDLPVDRFFGLNRYENIRLGLGVKLNENFNKYISPDAYAAYGFRDHTWKYGAGVDIRTTLNRDANFRVEYNDDVAAAGRFNQNLWSGLMSFMNSGASIETFNFYHFKGYRVSYLDNLTNSFSFRILGERQKEQALFPYEYQGRAGQFINTNTILTLKYSPNSTNIMTPSGKYVVDSGYPEFYVNYERGWKTLDGEFNYNRFDFLAIHQFQTRIGVTGVRLYGGIVSSDSPIWTNFEAGGLLPDGKNSFYNKFNLTTYLGFATMPSGKYYQDRFGAYYFTHRIPWYFKSIGKNVSSIDVIYKGIIGDMQHPEYHNFQFDTLHNLYQEVGFEWNNFMSSQFNLGFFYRVGHYNTGSFKDNFAIQLKLKVLGF